MGLDNCWEWKRKGEYQKGIFVESEKCPKVSIHFCAAMSIGFKSRISISEEVFNSDVYIETLKSSGFLSMADQTFGE
jgi:hypothetical protein